MNTIDLYYWGDQCPHNSRMKKLLETFKDRGNYAVNFFDITDNFDTAMKLNIFSPTLLIFDNKLRLHGPVKREKVEEIRKGNIPEPVQYKVDIGNKIVEAELRNLTEATISDTCMLCAPASEREVCSEKGKWIEDIRLRFNLPHLGKLHYINNECVGGAEFVPSSIVPYPIPRAEDTAFLTCSFLSDEAADYKSYPLQKLEEELPSLGYKAIIAITSEESCFPNGPFEWFLNRGYIDMGEVFYEKQHIARMHLVKKEL